MGRNELFERAPRPWFIAMVHVGAMPGTPRSLYSVSTIAARAAEEARLLAESGADAILIENMHDLPYLRQQVGPEVVAGMTAAACAVRAAVSLPLGVQVLAAANRAAIATAHAAGGQFVRVENFVFAHVADEGLMPEAEAGPLLRYRRQIGAEGVSVWADIKKKHAAHALTVDVGLADTARAAEFAGADAVIITGTATGLAASPADVEAARAAVSLPVLVGSGTTPENIAAFGPHADGFIVGSYFKREGVWSNPPDAARLKKLAAAFAKARR